MYQKDYILRMIEMLAEMLAAIMGLIKKGHYKQADIALENAYQNLLHEDAAFFYKISSEKLTETLIHEHNYTNGHLQILAELFLAEAELKFASQKIEKSSELFQKALILFEFLEKETKSYSTERISKIDRIKQKIDVTGSDN